MWIALLLAIAVAAPFLWYNFKDFFVEADRELSANYDPAQHHRQAGFLEERLEIWFGRVKILWQVAFPLFVFWLVYTILSSVDW